jgi:NADH-quinone oxidoreductase subunit J
MNAIAFTLFGLSALAALIGALFTIVAQNPIRSAMGLLLAIGGVTGLFLGLNAQFLAAIELIVYAGAVVILFVFVIMLIGPDATPPTDSKAAFARGFAAIVFSICAVTTGILLVRASEGPHAFPPSHIEHGTIEAFGRELFTKGLVPFELTTALFVVAVVGAIAVARGRHSAEAPSAEEKAASEKSRTAELPVSTEVS